MAINIRTWIAFSLALLHYSIEHIHGETVSGCTINQQNRPILPANKTFVTLSCANNGFILVRNLTFGVHRSPSSSPTCSYQEDDCTTRTTYIGMECNGLTSCNLDLNPQYLHICSQYSDYMMLDYSCLQGESLSICENRLVHTSANAERQHRVLIRSPNYPNEYDNSLNCSCQVETTTTSSRIEFLDFYLEERDEINTCSRDYLQIGNRSFCDSRIDEQDQSPSIDLNSSSLLTFKSNDVITRKGFWLMIISAQPIQVTCRNALEPSTPLPPPTTTVVYKSLSSSSLTPTTNTSRSSSTRRYTLSFILIVIIVFVITLLLINLILVTLCCRQRRRRSKESINSKNSSTRRPFFCSKRSSDSSSSSITYHETPVLHALDPHKRLTASGRFLFGTRQHSDTTPSTSITTAATGVYEDPNELMTLQRQTKVDQNHSLYIERPPEPMTFCPIVLSSCSTTAGYNRMFHYSSIPFHCHCKTSAAPSTFYPPQEHCSYDAQHVYETIKDGFCPYQRFAATLRREPSSQGYTCHCPTHTEQTLPGRPDGMESSNSIVAINPETLV